MLSNEYVLKVNTEIGSVLWKIFGKKNEGKHLLIWEEINTKHHVLLWWNEQSAKTQSKPNSKKTIKYEMNCDLKGAHTKYE